MFNRFGFDIKRVQPASKRIRVSNAEAFLFQSNFGFKPRTVVDIGAASGTPELYAAFPSAYFLLIEPVNVFEPDLNKILQRYRGSYVIAAAGQKAGKVPFFVHDDFIDGSSLYNETMGEAADGTKTMVNMVKIDDVLDEKQLKKRIVPD